MQYLLVTSHELGTVFSISLPLTNEDSLTHDLVGL